MTIRTVLLGSTDWADGQILYSADLNDTLDAISLKEEYIGEVDIGASTYSLTDDVLVTFDVSGETNLYSYKLIYMLPCAVGDVSSSKVGTFKIKTTFTDSTTQTDTIGTITSTTTDPKKTTFQGIFNYTKRIEKVEIIANTSDATVYASVRRKTNSETEESGIQSYIHLK